MPRATRPPTPEELARLRDFLGELPRGEPDDLAPERLLREYVAAHPEAANRTPRQQAKLLDVRSDVEADRTPIRQAVEALTWRFDRCFNLWNTPVREGDKFRITFVLERDSLREEIKVRALGRRDPRVEKCLHEVVSGELSLVPTADNHVGLTVAVASLSGH